MPAKSKKDKRKKKKGRLTNEEILKLIKKLKPKNQQTVRINIGDKEEKKKPVSNQPPVRTEVSYFSAPPPTAYFQPPQPPLLINKPPPSLAETKAIFDAPTQEEKQLAVPNRLKKRRKPKPIEQEEFMSDEPIRPISYFQEPNRFKKSVLGENASRPLRYAIPVENDRYQPELIQTNQSQDQIGNRSIFNMSSDTWTLAPDGNVQSIEEIQQAQPQAPVEAPPNEEEMIQEQTDLFTEESAQKAPMIFDTSEESEAVQSNLTIRDVNRLIREGKVDIAQFQVDPNVVYKTGKKRGQLRKEITSRELANILQTIDKQGIE